MSIKFIGLTIKIQYIQDNWNIYFQQGCETFAAEKLPATSNQLEIIILNYIFVILQLKMVSTLNGDSI